ncbi:MAG: tRNA 2-thiouridine(34) synthase MnmA [Fidelibacterota bacterium]
MQKRKKILVGISGGVDSSAALYLLKEQGYDPVGITLKVITNTKDSKFEGELERTRKLCQKLSVKHIVRHVEQEFYDKIIMDFVNTYLQGETPNPCVVCNKQIKWKFLLSEADKLGINFVATGHYARIIEKNGQFELHKGIDEKKDQSYMLWQLGQTELSRTKFPLGEYTKDEIRKIARAHSLVPDSLAESQDICFIPENDYRKYLKTNFFDRLKMIGKGDLVETDGTVVGQHEGFYNFTIGQRKGFKIGFGERRYVKQLDAENNRIVIAKNDDLYSKGAVIQKINFPVGNIQRQVSGTIKIRYNHKGVLCRGEFTHKGLLKITFDQPQRAVTPGQTAVLYNEDKVILGGIIKEIL